MRRVPADPGAPSYIGSPGHRKSQRKTAEQVGEVTGLPAGAVYEALDGSGRKWRYGGEGWSPLE